MMNTLRNRVQLIGNLGTAPEIKTLAGGKKVAKQQLDDNEQIELLLLPVEEVRAMLQRNGFVQALHVSCFMYAFQLLDSLKE